MAMDKLQYSVIKVLEIVTKNRDNHVKEVEELQEDRSMKMQEIADKQIEILRDFSTYGIHAKHRERDALFSWPSEIPDHEDDYNKAILKLELCSDAKVVLTSEEFDNLMMDEWYFSANFNETKISYGKFL